MRVIAYIRVSTARQDLDQQRLAIWDYAQKNRLTIDEFVTAKASSQKSMKRRKIGDLLTILQPTDVLLVSELSRLGIGRPKGVLGKSRLDGKEEEIRLLLQKRVSKSAIARILSVPDPTLRHFIKTRRLGETG